MAQELARLRPAAAAGTRSRSGIIAAAAVMVAILTALAGWWARHESGQRWAREKALPEAMRLTEQGSYAASFDLAQKAGLLIPSDPILGRLLPEVSSALELDTVPLAARVRYKEYADRSGPWRELGTTPIRNAHVPRGFFRWHITGQKFVHGWRTSA